MVEQHSLQSAKELPQFAESENEAEAARYLQDLGLSWEDLKGKEILDIGAGFARFAQVAKNKGVEVTSLDIDTTLPAVSFTTEPIIRPTEISSVSVTLIDVPFVVADARKPLPFPDECFDIVVAHAAIPVIINTQQDLAKLLQQVKRVLRSNGEFRFGPGMSDVKDKLMNSEEKDVLFTFYDRMKAGEILTEDEEQELKRLEANIDSDIAKERQEREEMRTFPENQREEWLKQKAREALEIMHTVEPNISMHTGSSGVYYLMKKNSASFLRYPLLDCFAVINPYHLFLTPVAYKPFHKAPDTLLWKP